MGTNAMETAVGRDGIKDATALLPVDEPHQINEESLQKALCTNLYATTWQRPNKVLLQKAPSMPSHSCRTHP